MQCASSAAPGQPLARPGGRETEAHRASASCIGGHVSRSRERARSKRQHRAFKVHGLARLFHNVEVKPLPTSFLRDSTSTRQFAPVSSLSAVRAVFKFFSSSPWRPRWRSRRSSSSRLLPTPLCCRRHSPPRCKQDGPAFAEHRRSRRLQRPPELPPTATQMVRGLPQIRCRHTRH